jgi:hypothetical protein
MKEFKFLDLLTRGEIREDTIDDNEIKDTMHKVFTSVLDVDSGKLKNHEICMVIMTYLSFLFDEQFRKACIQLC